MRSTEAALRVMAVSLGLLSGIGVAAGAGAAQERRASVYSYPDAETEVEELGPARVDTSAAGKHGEHLVDGYGRTLYLFKGDHRGKQDDPAVSTCYQDCAEAWPPLMAHGSPSATGEAKQGLLSTVERRYGGSQVTYGGWPLYLYVRDFGPLSRKGQGVKDFDAYWYMVSPDGEAIGEPPAGAE